MPALDGLADHVHMVGRAMVGAQTRVLRCAPAKLGKHQHRHIVGAANTLHVLHESGHGIGHIGQQALVQFALLEMGGVQVSHLAKIKFNSEPGCEEV